MAFAVGQPGAEQRGPLPLGEAGLAGAAVKEPVLLGLAVVTADGQIALPPLTIVGAIRVLAAEAGQVLRHGDASAILGRERRGHDDKLLISEGLTAFNNLRTRPIVTDGSCEWVSVAAASCTAS